MTITGTVTIRTRGDTTVVETPIRVDLGSPLRHGLVNP